MNYRSVNDIKDVGPCLLPGHPKEHVLTHKCWQKMRQFLFDHSFAQYIAEVQKKS